MNVNDIIDLYLKQIVEHQDKILSSYDSIILLDNFYNASIATLEDVLDKDIKEVKKIFKSEVDSIIKNNLKEVEKQTKNSLNDLNKSIKMLVRENYTNYLFNSSLFELLIKECKNKLNNINNINKDFHKEYDKIFELFLYNLSIKYDLKGEINLYNLINKTVNQNKKILFDNIKTNEDNLKQDLFNNYEHYIDLFNNDIMVIKDGINTKNQVLLSSYKEKIVEENIIIETNDSLKTLAIKITNILNSNHKNILKLSKKQDNKEKKAQLNSLNSYLINYIDTLFDKSKNTLLKLNLISCNSKEDLTSNSDKYQDIMYKICDFYYNFDKVFSLYKKEMLNRTYFLKTSTCVDIADKITLAKEEVIKEIRKETIKLFESNINLMNNLNYKKVNVSSKIANYFKVLNEEEIKKLLK